MYSLTESELQEIKKILFTYIDKSKNKTFIFGSRASGTSRKYSDVNIGIEGEEVPLSVLGQIHAEFEESNLPYTVDIVDFSTVSPRFKAVASEKILPL